MKSTPPRFADFLKPFLQLASTRFGGWFFTTATPPIDRWLLRRSAGRASLSGLAAPTLLLTTTGRRTGKPRATPLLFLEDNGRLVVIGSRGGRSAQASWYLNLLALPRADVLVDGHSEFYAAIVAAGDERLRLWERFVAFNPGFVKYQARLKREIPVIILVPLSARDAS